MEFGVCCQAFIEHRLPIRGIGGFKASGAVWHAAGRAKVGLLLQSEDLESYTILLLEPSSIVPLGFRLWSSFSS